MSTDDLIDQTTRWTIDFSAVIRNAADALKNVIDLDSVTVWLAMLVEVPMLAHLQSRKGWNLGAR